MTSTRPDCGWAPLMGIWAAGGSVAPEQVHQESWDSAPRGTCPPAGGQQGAGASSWKGSFLSPCPHP